VLGLGYWNNRNLKLGIMSLFVTIEGVEGAGKSTLRSKLVESLRDLDCEILVSREPGATDLGLAIRQILLDPNNKDLNEIAELLLFTADRAQHVAQVIRPALARGAVVLCDRYIHSTIAYQGYGRGLSLEDLQRLNELATGGLKPDLVLLLDLDVKTGLGRVQERTTRASRVFSKEQIDAITSGEVDRMEKENISFHERVRKGFLELAQNKENNFCVLDSSKAAEKVALEAEKAIRARLKSLSN